MNKLWKYCKNVIFSGHVTVVNVQEGYNNIDDIHPQTTQHKSDVTKVDGNECYQIQLESGMF